MMRKTTPAIIMSNYMPYLNWIDTQGDILLQRIKKWVSFNSFSFNLEGLSQLLHHLQQDFACLQGTSEQIALSPLKKLTPQGTVEWQHLGHALRIRKRPQAPLQVLLGGHYDTVYPSHSSFQNMEEQQNDIWIGPGVTDMKGGLAILLTALEALERSPFASQIGWEVLLNPDEEIGSPGSAPLFQAAAPHHHVGLIFEPAFPDGAFVSQRKGSANYALVVKGRSAHVGRDFAQGRSAVFALARVIHALEKFNEDQALSLNVSEITSQGPLNIVPALASCRINIRSTHVHTMEHFFVQLQQIATQFSSEGISMEIFQESFRPPKPLDANTQSVFEAYAQCAQDLHIPFHLRETGGVCDGNTLAYAGLPTLDTAGAVGGALHTHDEYLILSSLIERAKLAALFLFKFASQEVHFSREVSHVES